MEASYDELMASATVPERTKSRCVAETSPEGSLAEKRAYTKRVVEDKVKAASVKWAKKQRGRALTREEKIEVVLLQAKLRSEERMERSKAGPGRGNGETRLLSRVVHLLGRR